MTEQQRIREKRRGQRRRQIEEPSLLVTDRPREQEQTPAQADAIFAALVIEIAGERQPHRVISNERLWRENVQEVGE